MCRSGRRFQVGNNGGGICSVPSCGGVDVVKLALTAPTPLLVGYERFLEGSQNPVLILQISVRGCRVNGALILAYHRASSVEFGCGSGEVAILAGEVCSFPT